MHRSLPEFRFHNGDRIDIRSHFVEVERDLTCLIEELRPVLEADWISIFLLDNERSEFHVFKSCGELSGINPTQISLANGALKTTITPDHPDIQVRNQQSSKKFTALFGDADPSVLKEYAGFVLNILVDNQVVGLLTAARKKGDESLGQADWLCLDLANRQISLLIQNRILAHLECKSREQALTFREIGLALNSSQDLQPVLEMILDQIDRVVGYNSAAIILVSGKTFRISAYRKHQISEQSLFEGRISDFTHIQQVVEKKATVVVQNTSMRGTRIRNLPGYGPIHCWMGVPLTGKEEVIGLISLDSEKADYYSAESVELATFFANQAAIAIENARYYAFVHKQLEQLDALRATIADISSELQLPKLLESILKRASILLNAKGGDLGLYDEREETIHIVASYQMEQDSVGIRLAKGEGAMGTAFLTKKPVIIEDYSRWQNASDKYRKGDYHSVIAVPFMIGERVIGSVAIVANDPRRIFSKNDEYLLSLFAQHAAIAVENARLYQDAQEAAERRAILHQASQQIVGVGFEQEGVYKAIHSAAGQLMPVEAFVITVFDEETNRIVSPYLVDRNIREYEDPMPAEEGLSGIVLREGKTILINDFLNDPMQKHASHFGEGESVRSILAVPMHWRDKVIGMISAQSYQPYDYSPEDTYLLEMLATYAGIALENAHLFQHIQQLATMDSVTEISNRRHLFELGHIEFLRSNRFNRALSVIMIDIDNFKNVNDQYGHAAGDQVLSKLGKLLKAEVREVDVVARYGGEEFTVILPETSLNPAIEIAERIRRKINQTFPASSKETPHITVSVGVAEKDATNPDFDALVEFADKAMYKAKRLGRDRTEAYTPDLS